MNNDRFKFRVYNTKTKNWVHGPGQEIYLFGETVLLGGFMNGVPLGELNECVILQYTGLNDIRGNEIYEWDRFTSKTDPTYCGTVVHDGGNYHMASVNMLAEDIVLWQDLQKSLADTNLVLLHTKKEDFIDLRGYPICYFEL